MAPRGSDKSKVWFEYVRTTGRFTAWPIRWQGWAAMIVLIAGPTGGAVMLAKALPGVPSGLFVFGALALCFGAIFPMAYFKGRPAKRSDRVV
jgi:hypothetical protein